ncbi:MAG: 50S ribosomal protein L30 [Anaerolineaceae bacterium]|jgi:large subunit ribosomal protein L30|nr:MAG: 50S ribosomal protein L30 [Anaerolineaceae bacterium]
MAKQTSARILKITLVRSPIGNTMKHRDTLRALGLHRIGQTIEQKDTPTVRGMLAKVNHLVKIETQEEK